MKQLPIKSSRRAFSIVVLLYLFAACTKTVTRPYPAASQSRIKSFTIVNAPTPIAAVVDDNDLTITVYVPPTQFLTILQPSITVSNGATVSPASGTFVENIAAYFVGKNNITYTVTGADKSVTTYTLKIISQQPPLSFNEVSTDAANPVTYNHTISSYTNTITVYTTTPYPFSPSQTVSQAIGRASLMSATGKEYPLVTGGSGSPVFAGAAEAAYSYVNVPLGGIAGYNGATAGTDQNSPPPGLYWIKIQYYGQVTTLKNPIKIIYE